MSKEDWKYFYSDILKMKYAVNKKSGRIMTEDKIEYSKKEVDIIIKNKSFSLDTHLIKKIFNGQIVDYSLNKLQNLNCKLITIPKIKQKKDNTDCSQLDLF